RRRLGDGHRGGVRETVARPDDERLERVLGVEPGLGRRRPGQARPTAARHFAGAVVQRSEGPGGVGAEGDTGPAAAWGGRGWRLPGPGGTAAGPVPAGGAPAGVTSEGRTPEGRAPEGAPSGAGLPGDGGCGGTPEPSPGAGPWPGIWPAAGGWPPIPPGSP